MDSMELEREKGITIQSAATFCDWDATDPITGAKKSYAINIIDTPGTMTLASLMVSAFRINQQLEHHPQVTSTSQLRWSELFESWMGPY
jgi:hypothetical protein